MDRIVYEVAQLSCEWDNQFRDDENKSRSQHLLQPSVSGKGPLEMDRIMYNVAQLCQTVLALDQKPAKASSCQAKVVFWLFLTNIFRFFSRPSYKLDKIRMISRIFLEMNFK